MTTLDIHIIPCLFDNYAYLVHDKKSGSTCVVDPAEEAPVINMLNKNGWQLDYIINTHHHSDHTGGNIWLRNKTRCKIIGSYTDRNRIPGIDITVDDGDKFELGDSEAEIIFIPGHTLGHIAVWFKNDKVVFTGDTLFAIGCGRVFEGTFEQMWTSIDRLRQLPEDTKIYCGHEYTVRNAQFAMTVDLNNQKLQQRFKQAKDLRLQNLPTIPSTISEEKDTNPFFRPEDPEIRAILGLINSSSDQVFTRLRQLKDAY